MHSINGYEQHQLFSTGFHANGLDVNVRLKNLGLCIRWHPDLRLYHEWHPSTLVSDPVYDLQRQLIRWRELSLDRLAFFGVDPKLGRDLPPELARSLRQETERQKSRQISYGNALKDIVRRAMPPTLKRAIKSIIE